uniref:Uncharacterized protein n=1 Tax=Clandestinovirus TaxID=2831644 RepID=A0A8F8KTJ2_9VIRU|nr:hypothetical protein KOM_12_138 [Clandestinovirus]
MFHQLFVNGALGFSCGYAIGLLGSKVLLSDQETEMDKLIPLPGVGRFLAEYQKLIYSKFAGIGGLLAGVLYTALVVLQSRMKN